MTDLVMLQKHELDELVDSIVLRVTAAIDGIERGRAPHADMWLTYSRFILVNHMGRTRFTRLVREKKVESMDTGGGRKLYRWRQYEKQ